MDNEKREFDNIETEENVLAEVAELNEEVPVETTDNISDEVIEEDVEIDDDVCFEEGQDFSEEACYEEDEHPAMSEEMLQELKAEKKRRTIKALGISAIVAFILIVVGFVYSICVINGVGSKNIVNTSMPAKYSAAGEKLAEEEFDIKFENPFKSLLGGKNANVLTVNNYGIGLDVFEYFVKSSALNYEYELYQNKTITDLKSFDWNAINEETKLKNSEIAKGDAVKSMSYILAIVGEAQNRGIVLSEDEVKSITDWAKQIKESYGENLENALKQSGYDSIDQLIEIQKLQTIYQKACEAFNEEPLSYVKQYKDYIKYLSDSKISVRHILVQFPEGITAESTYEEKAETRKEAEEVLKKAKAGEDFDELVFNYSDDPGQPKSGYTFANDGSMVQEFADASFKLNIGDISEIVETSFGYHIIKRTERIPDFEEYVKIINDNMKIRINRFAYSDIKVDVDLSEYIGEESSQDNASVQSAE